MFNAQYLLAGNAVYSPWMDRQGDYIRVTAEVIAEATADLEVKLYTKARETTGDGTPLTGTLDVTAAGIVVKEWDSLNELVRYKMRSTGSTASHYVLFRMLEPVWFDAVKA